MLLTGRNSLVSLALQAIDFLCWNKKLIEAEAITGGTSSSSGLSSWPLEKGCFRLFSLQWLIAGKSQPLCLPGTDEEPQGSQSQSLQHVSILCMGMETPPGIF